MDGITNEEFDVNIVRNMLAILEEEKGLRWSGESGRGDAGSEDGEISLDHPRLVVHQPYYITLDKE